MSYSKFKRKVEKVNGGKKFVEKVDNIIVYVKMVGVKAKISHSIVFNWLAMIHDDSNYEPYQVEQEVLTKGEFGEDDLKHIMKELYQVHKLFEQIVEDFETQKDMIVSLSFDEDTRRADLSIYKDEPMNYEDLEILYGHFGQGHFGGGR